MTTKKKEVDEMTFKEFWEEEEKKETDKETVEKDKRVLLEILHEKGFTDKQINEMKMDRVQQICWPVIFETLERKSKVTERSVSKLFKQYMTASKALATLWKIPEKRKLLLTDKGLRKEVLELAAGMNDIERGLFDTEELARQFLEEIKKNRDSKKKD